MNRKNKKFRALVIGASAGGVEALNHIFSSLPPNFYLPIVAVLHLSPSSKFIPSAFHVPVGLVVKEAEEKEHLTAGTIYFAPPNYHLLVESDETLGLSNEELVHFARPSIDVTFLSISDVFQEELIGVILTGANDDGAEGLKVIKERGGLTIVQDPSTARAKLMPQSALDLMKPDFVDRL